jgi:hypothetical protein
LSDPKSEEKAKNAYIAAGYTHEEIASKIMTQSIEWKESYDNAEDSYDQIEIEEKNISERNGTKCSSQADIDSREKAIKTSENEIIKYEENVERINTGWSQKETASGRFDISSDDWLFLRDAQLDLYKEVKQAKVGDRAALRSKISVIEDGLKNDRDREQLLKAFLAAGLPDEEAAEKVTIYFPDGEPEATKKKKPVYGQIELIEHMRTAYSKALKGGGWDNTGSRDGFIDQMITNEWSKIIKLVHTKNKETVRKYISDSVCDELGVDSLPVPWEK